MIVAKFGGAVLDGAAGLRRVCDEIRSLPRPLLVVVSAFADVTNMLERLAETALADPHAAAALLDELIDHHTGIARDLLSDDRLRGWLDRIEPYRARLREVIQGLGIVRELSPRTLDLVVHFGERLSSALVLAALGEEALGITALDLIITDDRHRYARPDLTLTAERVEERLRPLLGEGRIIVTEGYIARGSSGQATTMGRESSNYSATLLAGMLAAAEVRIYTRFPGILTADPRLLPEARTIPRMSYGMAKALAELGAKVLHPRTVAPVERAGIPLVITGIGGGSTTIGGAGGDGYSVAVLGDATLLSIETGTASVALDPFIRALAAEVPIIWQQRFRRRLQVLLAGRYPHPSFPTTSIAEPVEIGRREVAVISVVREEPFDGASLRELFGALGELVPLAVQGGIDSRAASVAVPREIAADVARGLHERFSTGGASEPVGASLAAEGR
jgi:hypothetical protein